MEGDGPEPIEIELISHEPRPERASRWRRGREPAEPTEPTVPAEPAGLASVPDSPGPPPEPGDPRPGSPARSERTRLVVTAAVVGVLALALGWLVGRSSGDDGLAVDDPPTSAAPTTLPLPFATLPIDGEAIDPADFDDPTPPTTRLPRTTTTTEVVGPTTAAVPVDARMSGSPVRLIGVELGGVLVEADLASGTLTDFGASRISSDGGALVVGPDWVVVGGNSGSRVIRSDGTDEPIDIGEPWQPLHIPGTELFWRSPFDQPVVEGPTFTLVDLAGEPVGPTIVLPMNAWPYLVDPSSGGVVASNVPRNYAITPDGVEYLGTGELVGISETQIVAYDCDEALVCSLYRTDRDTGETTLVPVDADLDEPLRWQSPFGWGGISAGSLSPDGRWVAVVGSSWRSTVAGIIDLATGRFVEITRDSYPPTIVWSPDSRWAFTLDNQVVVAYDTATHERFPVFTDSTRWIQIGVRPNLPSTDPTTPTDPVTTTEPATTTDPTVPPAGPASPSATTPSGSAPAEEAVEG